MPNQPKRKINIGTVKCTVWENETKTGKKVNSFNFSRSYRDQNGDWQESQSFNAQDLPVLLVMIQSICNALAQGSTPKKQVENKNTGYSSPTAKPHEQEEQTQEEPMDDIPF